MKVSSVLVISVIINLDNSVILGDISSLNMKAYLPVIKLIIKLLTKLCSESNKEYHAIERYMLSLNIKVSNIFVLVKTLSLYSLLPQRCLH